jgi:DNA-binding NtrC family response regulator
MTKSIRSILLVDNDDQARENLAVKLRNDIGCVVIEASQPSDASAILQDENVNLLITDLFMPTG